MVGRGDPPPFGRAWRAATLESTEQAALELLLSCGGCGHSLRAAPGELMAWHGLCPALPLYSLAQRLYCRVCGGRAVSVMIAPHDTSAGSGGRRGRK